VRLGCAWNATPPARRPGATDVWAWPEFAQRCISGEGESHPLHILDASAVLIGTTWEPASGGPIPLISVAIEPGHTSIGLAPPIEQCVQSMIVDTHWLAVPKGRVNVEMTEGSGRCWMHEE
jgi:hypothetical protein